MPTIRKAHCNTPRGFNSPTHVLCCTDARRSFLTPICAVYLVLYVDCISFSTPFRCCPALSLCAMATRMLKLTLRCRGCADMNSLSCVFTPFARLITSSVLISCTFVLFCAYVLFVTFSQSPDWVRSGLFRTGIQWLAIFFNACNENSFWLISCTNIPFLCTTVISSVRTVLKFHGQAWFPGQMATNTGRAVYVGRAGTL